MRTKKKNHLVSVITPCYNGKKYIAETIESVLAQTYTNWEMLIIDDGSTDGSAELIQTYSRRDYRICLLRQENRGSAAARNLGIREAKGRYIALLDADDVWEPDFLKRQLWLLYKSGSSLVYSSYSHIDGESREYGRPVRARKFLTYEDMCIRNYIGCLTGLYDTAKYGKVYLREELKSLRDDYAYWLDILKKCGRAYGNPRVLAKYRVLESSTTGNKLKLIPIQFRFYRDYLKLPLPQCVLNLLRWGIAGIWSFS